MRTKVTSYEIRQAPQGFSVVHVALETSKDANGRTRTRKVVLETVKIFTLHQDALIRASRLNDALAAHQPGLIQ